MLANSLHEIVEREQSSRLPIQVLLLRRRRLRIGQARLGSWTSCELPSNGNVSMGACK